MSLTFSSSHVNRPIVVLPIAIALITAAAALLWTNLTARDDTVSAGAKSARALVPSTTIILVSSTDIPRGRLLGAADFAVKNVTLSQAPAGALSRVADADGHMALKPIAVGAPLLKDAISDGAVMGLSGQIPESYRAYSVPVSEANIAGGFVEAGDRVDLYVTLPGALFADTAPQGKDRSKAALLLQSVEVLAVGSKLKSDGSPAPAARTVTLAVASADLPRLALATRLGTLSFAIRNPVDDSQAQVSEAELANLVSSIQEATAPLSATPPSVAPARARRGVPLYAGRDRLFLPVP
jgi:pilus assembly protein CpaB